ncbi:MAG: bifunctional (p)ppGpp synthetase/guanosine-3',5'-bis(diphosphate) 3'-pyrophosphohydrolase [Clostridiales bacterium]|nr:bifunctional (p)ppGpp synthetase/guanosine-3',5'-bis(diphosphate) 3'-pyrophosphohydrolase [Clostridiales bacterium]
MSYEELYSELIEKLKLYYPSQDLVEVEKAYLLALEAHKKQLRKSGEPYIIHPLSVSIILSELKLDLKSIEAGLLHDVIEDSEYLYSDIVRMFGEDVAMLVDGVTKLEKMPYISKEEQQAENYRKMFFAMAKDLRVILIKMADRLHNMRTLSFQPPAKQKEIAQETLDIYAPLAHRLGISKLRYELEDLSFKYLYREDYYNLAEKVNLKQTERMAYVNRIIVEIRKKIELEGKTALIEGRPKHFFSIYKKMIGKNKSLDQIFDLFAVRIIVETVQECYNTLGLLHELYKPVPGRFKDYIGMPKSNHYQSLHTTLIGPGGEPFEVQIRTAEMHKIAEYGIAAHWKYKEGKGGAAEVDSKMVWLGQILEWQRDFSDNKEFLDAIKNDFDVFEDHVYCFSPKGDVYSLISGATPMDFAYAVHTAVGNKMVGAKVNGKIVNFDYPLSMGDRVEIITSQNTKGPSADWLKMVKTSQARSKINQWLKKENREENIIKGRELLEKEAKKKNLSLKELINNERVKRILNRFNCADWDSLCATIGYGGIKESQIISKLFEEQQQDEAKNYLAENPIVVDESDSASQARKKKGGVAVEGVGDVNVRLPKCCNPIPGDEIVGYVTRGRGLTVHRTDCVNIINLDELERHRLMEVQWSAPDNGVKFRSELRITGPERLGLLFDVSAVLKNERISVKSMSAKVVAHDAILTLGVEISGTEQLSRVTEKLKKLRGVYDVERVIL